MDPLLKVVTNPFEKAPDPNEPLSIVIARLDTMDLDGDIFKKYVWKDSGILMSPWGHDMKSPPAAIGPLKKRSDNSISFTPDFIPGNGDATERALRKAWDIVEFSYAFYPTKDYEVVENEEAPWGYSFIFEEVQIFEASPVHKGASIDTGIGKDVEPTWRKALVQRELSIVDKAAPNNTELPSTLPLTIAMFKARLVTI